MPVMGGGQCGGEAGETMSIITKKKNKITDRQNCFNPGRWHVLNGQVFCLVCGTVISSLALNAKCTLSSSQGKWLNVKALVL